MVLDFEYDVFLSHSSKDKPVVRELAERLKADGLRVWLDEWVIQPGDSIPLAIEQGLESSRTLVLVMSEHSVGKQSTSEWVTLERHTALFRDPTNQQRRFIPLRLDDANIKDSLKQFAYVDWREKGEDQYSKLLTACGGYTVLEPHAERSSSVLPADEAFILEGHSWHVGTLSFTTDGRWLLSGSSDRTIRVWELQDRKCHNTIRCSAQVFSIVAMPDDHRVVAACTDNRLRVYDIHTGGLLHQLEGHDSVVSVVCTLPTKGPVVVSGSYDGTIRSWNAATGECLHASDNRFDRFAKIYSIAASPDGCYVFSGSTDATIRVWETSSWNCGQPYQGIRIQFGH